MPLPKLILASRSPRRRQLMEEAGYAFEVIAPDEDVECGVCSESGPAGLVAELAYRKAAAVRTRLQRQVVGDGKRRGDTETGRQGDLSAIVVAADTVAECDGVVLGKPRDEEDARAMLELLRGRLHRVLTGLSVWPVQWRGDLSNHPQPGAHPTDDGATRPLIRVAVTQLRMDRLSDAAIEEYLATGQWEGKAGGFGYQDRLGWVHVESGSESNVVGLPMELLAEMLAEVAPD